MQNLASVAEKTASKGVMVGIDIRTWNGILPSRQEWGGACIRSVGEETFSKIRKIRLDIIDDLESYSIPCFGGYFVPDAMIGEWASSYERLSTVFYDVVRAIAASRNDLVELSRITAANLCRESWNVMLGEQPPPSMVQHAANTASMLFPSSHELIEMFCVYRQMYEHPYSFMCSDRRFSSIDDGEKRNMAWRVVDELLAGNARKLFKKLDSALSSSNHWTARQSKSVRSAVVTFLRTDLAPSVGLSELSQNIMRLLDRTDIESVDYKATAAAVAKAANLANQLSSVSGFMGVLKQ